MDSSIFAERLRNLRMRRDIKQYQLADAVGVSARTIRNYEAGIQYPDYLVLLKITDYFNISVEYLAGKTKSLMTVQEIEKGLKVGNQSIHYDDIVHLKDEDKKLIIMLVKRLKEKEA